MQWAKICCRAETAFFFFDFSDSWSFKIHSSEFGIANSRGITLKTIKTQTIFLVIDTHTHTHITSNDTHTHIYSIYTLRSFSFEVIFIWGHFHVRSACRPFFVGEEGGGGESCYLFNFFVVFVLCFFYFFFIWMIKSISPWESFVKLKN